MGGFSVKSLASAPAGAIPGAVGVNENFSVVGAIDAPGMVRVAGAVNLAGGSIQGNLRARYEVSAYREVSVGKELFAGGDVTGPFVVTGGVHAPYSASVSSEVLSSRIVRESVSVPDPCDCDWGPLFSIGTAVAGRRTENANGILPFAGVFLEEITTSQTFDWPCGEFYLSKLQTSRQAPIEFRIHGHVGIFVDGDVRLGNNLEVFLDPGASLDLVVAGTFSTSGRLFGAPTVPRHMRLWVGEAKVSLPDEIQFGAMVYAPSAAFTAGAGLVYSGSLFVSTVAINGDIGLTYDPGAADEGQLVCGVAPPPLIQ
jgi:hypothetical protein